jgi:hypothetical protein
VWRDKKKLFCEIFSRTGYFVLKFKIKVNFIKIVTDFVKVGKGAAMVAAPAPSALLQVKSSSRPSER